MSKIIAEFAQSFQMNHSLLPSPLWLRELSLNEWSTKYRPYIDEDGVTVVASFVFDRRFFETYKHPNLILEKIAYNIDKAIDINDENINLFFGHLKKSSAPDSPAAKTQEDQVPSSNVEFKRVGQNFYKADYLSENELAEQRVFPEDPEQELVDPPLPSYHPHSTNPPSPPPAYNVNYVTDNSRDRPQEPPGYKRVNELT